MHAIRPLEVQRGRVRYLHDADAPLPEPVTLFAIADRHLAEHQMPPAAGAPAVALRKASITRFAVDGVELASRRYFRGGAVARLSRDTYLGIHIERTRMWREFHLLAAARRLGLPVPEPVAARCERPWPAAYRGDLVTRWIPGTRTLTDRLRAAPLPPAAWAAIGRTVRRFQEQGVFHADLNADNVLLEETDAVHLIDFDKGRVRPPAAAWWRAMLERLRRSLRKKRATFERFHYDDERDWGALLEGRHGGDAG